MGIISTIETRLEGIVENPFASKHRIDVVTLEIALNRLVEKEKVNILGVYMVPTLYFVALERDSARDYEPFFGHLSLRLEAALRDSCKEKGFKVVGNLRVGFTKGSIPVGAFSVSCQWENPSNNDQAKVSPSLEAGGSPKVSVALSEEKESNEANDKQESPVITPRDAKAARLINIERGESCIIDRTPFIIGRGALSQMVLDDGTVSDRHARIDKTYGKLVLEDLQSTNGTRVNCRYVRKAPLQDGDEIVVGNTVLIVET